MVDITFLSQIDDGVLVVGVRRSPTGGRIAVGEIDRQTAGVLKRRYFNRLMQCQIGVRQIPRHGVDDGFFLLFDDGCGSMLLLSLDERHSLRHGDGGVLGSEEMYGERGGIDIIDRIDGSSVRRRISARQRMIGVDIIALVTQRANK